MDMSILLALQEFRNGAERLCWELDKLIEMTILAMRSCEAQVMDFMNIYKEESH